MCSSLRWLDTLEKAFDRAFVESESSVRRMASELAAWTEEEEEEAAALDELPFYFSQLVHKATAMAQLQLKSEAHLLNARQELAEAEAGRSRLEQEKKYLLLMLQKSMVERQRNGEDQSVERRLDQALAELWAQKHDEHEVHRLQSVNKQLSDENERLRELVATQQGEIVGARLDAVYLDRELAGRIQQIQILLAEGTPKEQRQRVWRQIEAEMHLQRAKTIANMCYAKQVVKSRQEEQSNTVKSNLVVHVLKPDSENLGMAIVGGSEHNLPIMVSEVFPSSPVGRSKQICAGDLILAVNNENFGHMSHEQAAKYLASLRGSIRFELERNVDQELVQSVCDLEARLYQIDLHEHNVDDKDTDKEDVKGDKKRNELPLAPDVHLASPKRA